MHRTFTITLPADTAYHNLYSLIVGTAAYGLVNGGTNETGITGAIPTDGIMPDRVSRLFIQMNTANAGSVVNITDRNSTNSTGAQYFGGDGFLQDSDRNTICLKDYLIKGNALAIIVDLESK